MLPEEGHTQAVRQLLDWGAVLDTQDSHSGTALFLSVRVLLQAGAQVNVSDNHGVSIQQLARKQNMIELIEEYSHSQLLTLPQVAGGHYGPYFLLVAFVENFIY